MHNRRGSTEGIVMAAIVILIIAIIVSYKSAQYNLRSELMSRVVNLPAQDYTVDATDEDPEKFRVCVMMAREVNTQILNKVRCTTQVVSLAQVQQAIER